MEVLLDGSFIISCVKNRIDFLDQLKEQGFKPVVSREVLQEMKDVLKKSKTSHVDRVAIKAALEIIQNRKVKKTSFGSGKVDDYLIERGKMGIYVATLDRQIKRQIPNKVVIFSAKGKVGKE
jgi:rRNA-processing protein FCF1